MAVRITQLPIETSIAPSDATIRITQIPVETSIAPSDATIHITQLVVETSIAVNIVHQLTAFDSDADYQIPSPVYQGIQQDPNSELFTATNKTPPVTATDIILMDYKGYSIAQIHKVIQNEDPLFTIRHQPRIFVSS